MTISTKTTTGIAVSCMHWGLVRLESFSIWFINIDINKVVQVSDSAKKKQHTPHWTHPNSVIRDIMDAVPFFPLVHLLTPPNSLKHLKPTSQLFMSPQLSVAPARPPPCGSPGRVCLDGHIPRLLINWCLGWRQRSNALSLPAWSPPLLIQHVVSSPSHTDRWCHEARLKRFKLAPAKEEKVRGWIWRKPRFPRLLQVDKHAGQLRLCSIRLLTSVLVSFVWSRRLEFSITQLSMWVAVTSSAAERKVQREGP